MDELLKRFGSSVSIKNLSDEEKALLETYMLRAANVRKTHKLVTRLSQIHSRLLHQTEDIPDDELQQIVDFITSNAYEIAIIKEIEKR